MRSASCPPASTTTTTPSTSPRTRSTSAPGSRVPPSGDRAASRSARSRRRLQRLGPRRLHARQAPEVSAARGQHRARHDQPLAGAEGGRRASASISTSSSGACSRPASRARRHEEMSMNAARCPQSPSRGRSSRRRARAPVVAVLRPAPDAGRLALVAMLLVLALDRAGDSQVLVEGAFQRVSPAGRRRGRARGARRLILASTSTRYAPRCAGSPGSTARRAAPLARRDRASSITEQVAAARWGEDGLLNTRGELFLRAPATCRPSCRCSRARRAARRGGAALPRAQAEADRAPACRLTGVRARRARRWELALSDGVRCGSAGGRSTSGSSASSRLREPDGRQSARPRDHATSTCATRTGSRRLATRRPLWRSPDARLQRRQMASKNPTAT